MATTVEKIILDVRALFDELSKNGTILGEATVADLQVSAIRLVDSTYTVGYSIV